MLKPYSKQSTYLKTKGSVISQVLWLMVWPTLTVFLVVGAVYLDRMYVLKEMTSHRGELLVKAAAGLLHQSFRVVESDIKKMEASEIIQRFLTTRELRSGLEHELFNELENLNSGYRRISLYDTEGKVLIQKVKRHEPAKEKRPEQGHDVGTVFPEFEGNRNNTSNKIHRYTVDGSMADLPGQGPSVGMRFVKAVSAAGKKSAGSIVIDYFPADLFRSLSKSNGTIGGRLYFIDQDGIVIVDLISETQTSSSVKNSPNTDGINFAGTFPEVWSGVSRQGEGHMFSQGGAFAFSSVQPFSDNSFMNVERISEESSAPSASVMQPRLFFLVSEISSSYFQEQKNYYIRFLFFLAVALLVPSLVVCIFLARSRRRIRIERSLRYKEHEGHLAQLEEKVKQRTRELDDTNLRLSAEIAERLNIENRLRGSNELLSGMLESIDGIIYVSDMDSHEILFTNEYVKRLFGFDPVGRKCWQFIHASKDGPCTFCTNNKLVDDFGNPLDPCHWEYQNTFNKKWYAAKDQAIRWSNGKLVKLEIAIDITERKRLEHFQKEARKQAEVALGARSRFVALVAHDLKTPFFSITQMLRRILERETFNHKVHRQFLESIVENGYRMLQMIDNLLSIDRFEAGEVQLDRSFFNVSSMADDVLQNFSHPAFEKGIKLINNIPEGSSLYADRYLYFMVLNNMVSNAIKFSERGGEIELFRPKGVKTMSVAVRDSGRGMRTEYIKDLFRADVKTSSQGTGGERGSGLGLILCQDIIKTHDGVIQVESAHGEGTTFYIDLPECSSILEKR